MSTEFVRRLCVEQRKRLVGNLMDFGEKQLYPSLSPQLQAAYRDRVLAAVGAYHDATLDMLKASINDGTVVNEEALELLHRIHANTRRSA